MHFGFFWVALFFLATPISAAWGTPQRRYTLPTSSLVLVACPMVCSMASMFVLHAMAAVTLNLIFDAGWPILGPALVAAIVVAWLQAILWSTSNSQGLQLVSCLASFGILLFAVMQFAGPDTPATAWFVEGADTSHVLGFGLAALICVGAGTIGFANLRHGGGMDVHQIVEWASRLFPRAARTTPFPSPLATQIWLEWTERGHVVPVGTALIGVAVLLAAPFVAAKNANDFLGGPSTILLVSALLVGLFLGARSADGGFGNFNGSHPLTDSQLANAVLASVTVGVLSSALIWSVAMGAVSLILGQSFNLSSFPNTTELPVGVIRLLGIATLGIGTVWGAAALMTSLVLAGKKVSSVVLCTLIGAGIVGGIGSQLLRSPEAQETFRQVYRWLVMILSTVGIATVFVVGWRLRLIARGTLLMAVGIVAVMLAAAHLSGVTSEPDSLLLVLSGSCLTPSALAVAPLAVRWNRHR